MAAWIRDGEAPNEVKVSFVVNKADHPELVEWLWDLPFRQQSAVIRTVLSEAAKMVASGADLASPPAAVVAKANETPAASLPPSTVTTPAAVVVQPSVSALGNSSGMTAATAAILRGMGKDF